MTERDKARDDKYFDWNQDHEIEYVASRYGEHKEKVKIFLQFYKGLNPRNLSYMTHEEVYKLIKDHLKLSITQ